MAFTSEAVLETSLDHEEYLLSDRDQDQGIVHAKTLPAHETPVRQTRWKFKSKRRKNPF